MQADIIVETADGIPDRDVRGCGPVDLGSGSARTCTPAGPSLTSSARILATCTSTRVGRSAASRVPFLSRYLGPARSPDPSRSPPARRNRGSPGFGRSGDRRVSTRRRFRRRQSPCGISSGPAFADNRGVHPWSSPGCPYAEGERVLDPRSALTGLRFVEVAKQFAKFGLGPGEMAQAIRPAPPSQAPPRSP